MSTSRKQVKAQRRERRQIAQQTSVLVDQKSQRRRLAYLGLAALALLALVGLLAYFASRTAPAPEQVGRQLPDQGNAHIASATSPHEQYNSFPPTSGPHVGSSIAPAGFYDEPVAPELAVHSLEDGHVVIWYKPDLEQSQKERLRAYQAANPENLVVAPLEGLQKNIVLTAWTRMDELDTFDQRRIDKFVQTYKGIDHHR